MGKNQRQERGLCDPDSEARIPETPETNRIHSLDPAESESLTLICSLILSLIRSLRNSRLNSVLKTDGLLMKLQSDESEERNVVHESIDRLIDWQKIKLFQSFWEEKSEF